MRTRPLSAARVLVVDDERPNRETFRRCFRGEFEIRLAAGTEEALKLVAAERFDIALVDYAMPKMNGLDLLAKLAVLCPGTTRVMVTAHADLPELSDALATGLARAVLRKPWSKVAILECVANSVRPSAAPGSLKPEPTACR